MKENWNYEKNKKKLPRTFYSTFFPFLVFLSAHDSNNIFVDDAQLQCTLCHRPLVVGFHMFTFLWQCEHHKCNICFVDTKFHAYPYRNLLVFFVQYFVIVHDVHIHTHVACGCYFSDFVSILFKHKSFITHFLLWSSWFSIRCKKCWTPILLTSNKMQLKNAYSLFSKLQMYHNHFRFVTYVVQHSWDDLKTIHSIYLDFVPEVFNKQIKILKTTTTLRVHHEVDRNSTTVQFFQPLLNISGSFVDKLLNTGNFFDRNIGFWRCFCCSEIISIKFVFNRFILELKFDSQTMRIKAKAPEKMEFDAIQTEMIYQFEATSPLLFSPKIWWK